MSFNWSKTCLLLAAMLATEMFPTPSAQANDDIQVNVLVFAQPEHGISFELWRPAAELQLAYPSHLIDLNGSDTAGDERYIYLGSQASERMTRVAQKMAVTKAMTDAMTKEYRVLLQQSWTQPLLAPEQSHAVLIRGGQIIADHHELEGYLTLYQREQRIRLDTHLWLTGIKNSSDTAPATASVTSDVLPEITDNNGVSLRANEIALPLAQVVVLKDTRILNAGDLHYVDHPKFGMLIEIQGHNEDVPKNEDAPKEEAPEVQE